MMEACKAIEAIDSPSESMPENFSKKELDLISEVVPAPFPQGRHAGDHFLSCLHYT
jgi:hypothetical protein